MNQIDNLKQHWANLKPPLAPSADDVEIFQMNLIEGSSLLLGSTKELLGICDSALDISPVYPDKKIVVGDWIKNNTFYSNILGDGVLNFNEELCHALLDMAEKNSSQFLVRAFNHRLDIMKVANYFPSVNSFKIKPKVIYSSDIYNFYKWNFDHHA